MEKFIQLPILIPPTNKDKFRSYIGSLLSPRDIVKAIDNTYEDVKITSQNNDYKIEEVGIEINKDVDKSVVRCLHFFQ